MLHLTDVIQPKPDEHVEAVFRKHRLTLFPDLVLASLFIVTPFFWIFSLLHAGSLGAISFAVLLSVGAAIGLRALLLWDASALIITNERIIRVIQAGIWHRIVQEVSLHAIHELACESRGMFETFFRVGTLRIRAGGAAKELVVEALAAPERARVLIENLRGRRGGSRAAFAPPDVRGHVRALINEASPATLETIKVLLEKGDA